MFFGLLNPDNLLPDKADFGPGLEVTEFAIDENSIALYVQNGLGKTIRDVQIVVDECTGRDHRPIDIISAGAVQKIVVICGETSSPGSKFRSAMIATYETKVEGNSLSHTKNGELAGSVNEGMWSYVTQRDCVCFGLACNFLDAPFEECGTVTFSSEVSDDITPGLNMRIENLANAHDNDWGNRAQMESDLDTSGYGTIYYDYDFSFDIKDSPSIRIKAHYNSANSKYVKYYCKPDGSASYSYSIGQSTFSPLPGEDIFDVTNCILSGGFDLRFDIEYIRAGGSVSSAGLYDHEVTSILLTY